MPILLILSYEMWESDIFLLNIKKGRKMKHFNLLPSILDLFKN